MFLTSYDFVVIGGGSGGATVAGRLTALNFSVLLLEAGLEEPDINQVPAFYTMLAGTDIDWQYTTEPEKTACLNRESRKCLWRSGKVKSEQSFNYKNVTRRQFFS